MVKLLVNIFTYLVLFKMVLYMYENIAYRLSLFITHLGVTDEEFLLSVGLSGSIISKARSSGVFTDKSIQKVHLKYPQLNLDWLRYGEGDMLCAASSSRPSSPAPTFSASDGDVLRGLYERLLQAKDEQLALKDEEINRLRSELAALRSDNEQKLA